MSVCIKTELKTALGNESLGNSLWTLVRGLPRAMSLGGPTHHISQGADSSRKSGAEGPSLTTQAELPGYTKHWVVIWPQVTFLVTEDPSRAQGRVRREALSPLRFEPYEAIALASGGELIFTKDQHIRDVAAMVGESVAGLVSEGRPEGSMPLARAEV